MIALLAPYVGPASNVEPFPNVEAVPNVEPASNKECNGCSRTVDRNDD